MTYLDAIEFLRDRSLFGMHPGLDNTLRLAARAGNPQRQLRFIHVAGTNGKGSTCAMLESIYRTAGLRVGLFTSPHLVSFRERIQVNRELISEEDVARLAGKAKNWIEDDGLSSECGPTFFEMVSVMSLRYFAEQHCDLVIWETGLGGKLDATNIVTPLASVITNVAFDHEQWLGDTLTKIATEKAGIIKAGVPVITAADAPEAVGVIQSVAKAAGSPLAIVEPSALPKWLEEMRALPLFGRHQQVNAALAISTVATLREQLPATDEDIRRGLETVNWPGRFQILERPGGGTIILDGAHNPAGAGALQEAMTAKFPGTQPTLVLGVLKDKDQLAMCAILAPLAGRILVTPVKSERTASPEQLNELCAAAGAVAKCETCESLADALKKTARDPLVLVTGSLYLVGEALELLGSPEANITNERILNEWSRAK